VSDLKDKIQAIIYPNEKGLVWTREEQVNLLLALFEKQFEKEIRDDFKKLVEHVITQQKRRDLSYISGRRLPW
jgi:hypothetical protein